MHGVTPKTSRPSFDIERVVDVDTASDVDDFIRLYEQNFPIADEREDPSQWLGRIREPLPEPQPLTHLILARKNDQVVGGILVEHYRHSQCGLITYIVVDPAFRRQGLARALIDEARQTLKGEAESLGQSLNGLFAETENPVHFPGVVDPIQPQARLRAFARLGARRVDVPYVQPALDPNAQKVDTLLLLTFPLEQAPTQNPDGAVVTGFLHEFYRALRIADPDQDRDFARMRKALETNSLPQELTSE